MCIVELKQKLRKEKFNYSLYANKLSLKTKNVLQQALDIKIPGLSYIFDDTLRGEEVHNKHTNKPVYLPSLSDSSLFFWLRLKLDRSHVLLIMATEKCLTS